MGWGRSQFSDAQVSSGSTIQVPSEEVEEDECDRGLEAILKLLWERREGGSPLPGHQPPPCPGPRHPPSSGVTHLLWGLLEPMQPVLEAAPGAWSLLWAEPGPENRGRWCVRQGLGQRGEVSSAQHPQMWPRCPEHSHRPGTWSGCGAVCEVAGPGCGPRMN